MSNKDYLQRVKTWESTEEIFTTDGDPQRIYATRMRDNNGFEMIVIHFGDQKIEFHRDNSNMMVLGKSEGLPQEAAGEVLKLLDSACMDQCELPEIKK